MERKPRKPSFNEEKLLKAQGYRNIAGIDEAGRGALAGPVSAAAVILPSRVKGSWLRQVRDSKQLTPRKREILFDQIKEAAVAFGVGLVHSVEVDAIGIAPATRKAMKLAVEQLSPGADYLLIDYFKVPEIKLPQKGIKFGDSISFSIACASILAKVTRDRLMVEMDEIHNGYGLARHKGYGTREHVECITRLGPSGAHRLTFSPIKDMI